jgi:hypothetical protein
MDYTPSSKLNSMSRTSIHDRPNAPKLTVLVLVLVLALLMAERKIALTNVGRYRGKLLQIRTKLLGS